MYVVVVVVVVVGVVVVGGGLQLMFGGFLDVWLVDGLVMFW
jgi:hypothetical protein